MVWLIKTDTNGNEVWERIFGGPRDDWGYSVQQTSDGGYIIAGATESFGKNGNSTLWLIKTDANGNEIWDKNFGGSSDTVGYSVQQTRDGGYIVLGSKLPYSMNQEIWLIKTDANGLEVWDKTLGGSEDDAGKSVQQTSDGGYIITGSKPNPNEVNQDRLADQDRCLTATRFGIGLSGHQGIMKANRSNRPAMAVTSLQGQTFSYGLGDKNSAVWLIKTDANGNKVWDKTFDGA